MSSELEEIHELVTLVEELVRLAPWWAGCALPISEAEIADFEAEHGIALPSAYRAMLTYIGDRAPLPALVGGAIAPLRLSRALPIASSFVGPLADPFPHGGTIAVAVDWNDEADDYTDPLWLRGCLPLAEAGCDQSFMLVVSGPDRGRVWSVTPCGTPELHPTGLEFAQWYRAEIERGIATERARGRDLAALERRLEADPEDLEAAIVLGRALLLADRPRATHLLERTWARDQNTPGLARAIAELDLLTDRQDRIDTLAGRDPPWGRTLAALAAARRRDDARAVELFELGAPPVFFDAVAVGHHALSLRRLGRPERALAVLRQAGSTWATAALMAEICTQLGQIDQARQTWKRLGLGLRKARHPKPRAPHLIDFIELPVPSIAEVDAALAALDARDRSG